MGRRKKNQSWLITLLKFLFNMILGLLSLPYKIYVGISKLVEKNNQRTEQRNVKKVREAMKAEYQNFPLVKSISGDYDKWESKTINAESKIGIILGARGTGKTAFGIKFLENAFVKTQKSCYAMGFDEKDMPTWITVITDISQLKNDSFVLIDEGGIFFSSRESMTKPNKLLSDLILVARHKNLNILFISQNSSNLDVNILRQADYLVLKPSSLLQLDFERKKIKEIYQEVMDDFENRKDIKGLTYIYSDQFRGFVTNPLPSFWSSSISKSFK